MYCVSRLDLVCAQLVCILHHPTGVDQALSCGRDLLIFVSGQYGLEVEDGLGFRDGDGMEALGGGFDLEGDLRITCRCFFGHVHVAVVGRWTLW